MSQHSRYFWLWALLCAIWLVRCKTETVAPPSNLLVTEDRTITTDMTVNDLTVTGNAVLTIDYTASQLNRFTINGNVLVIDNAQLVVKGNATAINDEFIIANEYSLQRTFKSTGNSVIKLDHIVMKTQSGDDKGSVYMSYDALDHSSFVADGAVLETEKNWLLANFRGHSSLQATNTQHVPTELYVNDTSTVVISGAQTQTGIWMALTSGTHTMSLPNVAAGTWNWSAGADVGPNVHWSLSVTNANPGLGVQLFPDASATINGHGNAQVKELTIGYFVSHSNETLSNLHTGLQNGVIVPGRLTLNNVNLGPIAWQIYSVTPVSLTINNSTINEIGNFGSGQVTINSSVLQLAVMASFGQNSSISVNNSDVWNQSIEADNNGSITLTNCNVYGSLFNARQTASRISSVGGTFHPNPPPESSKPMIDLVSGYPNYNPFRTPGPPAKTGPGTVTCVGTANCSW